MGFVLKTDNLRKEFKGKAAVDGINLTVERGEIYGFIGRNGAGKTTAMRLIIGTALPTSGNIELFDGMPLSEARRKIGSLIEEPGLYKKCSAYENMKRFAILTDSSDDEIRENLELVGLADTGKKKAGQFSLGMRQRLGLAITLLGKPEFLVLDEPINGLDPEGIKVMRDIILKLNKERGITFLISSHLLDELSKVATRYGIIDRGVIVEEITPAELEAKCQSGLKLAVDDIEKAKAVLKERLQESEMVSDGGYLILRNCEKYGDQINTLLVKSGVVVREMSIMHGDTEQYFIERLGR